MEKRRGNIRLILRVLLLLVIFACVIYLVLFFVERKKATSQTETLAEQMVSVYNISQSLPDDSSLSQTEYTYRLAVDFNSLMAINEDIKAWIYIPAVSISYPVLYSGDNIFYLSHQPDKTNSVYGSIFIEAGCAYTFSDLHTIVYGHEMKDKSMFGSLKEFQSEKFFNKNGGDIYIALPGETLAYKIFSIETVAPSDSAVYTIGFGKDEEYNAFVSAMKARSKYDTGYTPPADAPIITLSTCKGNTHRLTVHAYLVENS